MPSKIKLGFSSCPNDTYIFDALVHKKIDWQGLDFEFIIADVEELNQLALKQLVDITKVSYFTYLKVNKDYSLLNSGGALGYGVGPLLISKKSIKAEDFENIKVAIPGYNTTANLLLSIVFPQIKNKTAMLFSEIEDGILSGKYDAGLIIHENRFTYEQKDLLKIADMGEAWEKLTNSPIPLGGIIAQNKLGVNILNKVQNLVKESVQFAFDNPESSYTFVHQHAASMEKEVAYKHINLYVNDFTLQLGKHGEKAIENLFKRAYEAGLIDELNQPRIIK